MVRQAILVLVWATVAIGTIPAHSQETSASATVDRRQVREQVVAPELVQELDAWIESTRQKWAVPGLSVAIVHRDQIVLSKGYGVRKLGEDALADRDTLYAIASNSKAFTAAGIAILVDEGKLRWDDPVHRYLPWLRLSDPLASQDLRVRDLLCHRSGLGTFSGDLLWWGTPYSPKEILQRAVHLPPENPFRGGYGYSNLMFLAAGEVIAAVSGQSWNEFTQERILQPVGMHRTQLSVTRLVDLDNVATPHKTLPNGSVPIEWMNWDAMGAAGGLISSVSDMSEWLRLQLRQGKRTDGTPLFSEATSYEMWQPQTIIPISKARSARIPSTHFRAYGLGWALSDYQGRKLVGHGGGYDGMYSEVLMVPEEQLGIVVLTNSMTPIGNTIAYTILDRVLGIPNRDWSEENLAQFQKSRNEFYQRIEKSVEVVVPNTRPSQPLENYAGTYECPMYGRAVVECNQGKLQLRLLPYPALTADLEHLHYDTFAIRWHRSFAWFESGSLQFVPDAKGQWVELRLDVPNDDLWFHELKLRRITSK